MNKNKKLAVMLAALMTWLLVLSNEMFAYAQENTETGLEVKYVDSLDDVVGKPLHNVSVDELSIDGEMEQKDYSQININEIDSMVEMPSFEEDGIRAYSSAGITQSFYGILEQQGTLTYLPLSLAPGQIIQATLEGPNNASIDYDLLLYTYNDDGSFGTCVAQSTLNTYINSNPGKSVEDAISYINMGSASQNYAVIVIAAMGCSSTETFKLTVSLDNYENYDAGEPNDNPFSAVTIPDGAQISGCNLNVSNDQDWYVWNVSSSFAYVGVSLGNSNYTVEVYKADGQSMIWVQPNGDGLYSLGVGKYYFRVYNKNANFISSTYTLSLQAYGKTPARMTVSFNGDMGSDVLDYSQGIYHRFENVLKPEVMIEDASGYPIYNYKVLLYWESGARTESAGMNNMLDEAYTDKYGIATFDTVPFHAIGMYEWTGSGFRHYYDIDYLIYRCEGLVFYQTVYHVWRTEPIR